LNDDDIEAEVADLRGRGITFEEFAGATLVGGIREDPAGRTAWFRDSEGNLLNVRSNRPPGT
jgi:predicted enzyme related to lactoylglutathione lyase